MNNFYIYRYFNNLYYYNVNCKQLCLLQDLYYQLGLHGIYFGILIRNSNRGKKSPDNI